MKFIDRFKTKRAIRNPVRHANVFCDWYYEIYRNNPEINEGDCSLKLIKKIWTCLDANQQDIISMVEWHEKEKKQHISIFFAIEQLLRFYLTNDQEILEAVFEVINPQIKEYFEKNKIDYSKHPVLKANHEMNELIITKMVMDLDKSERRIETYLAARSMLNGKNLLGRYTLEEVRWMVNEIIGDTKS